MPDDASAFRAYVRLWVVTESLLHFMQPFMVPHRYWIYAQGVLFTVAAAWPTGGAAAAAMAARIAMYMCQAPMIWDSAVWANFTDTVFAVACLMLPSNAVVPSVSDIVRVQMGLFYVGAGFWKINTAFLARRTSCAPIFVASLASSLPAALTPSWLIGPLLSAAPAMTIIGELAMGFGLLSPLLPHRRVSVVLSQLLHYAIAICPHPNSVSCFGVFCVARLFFTMPEACGRRRSTRQSACPRAPPHSRGVPA